jgi:predicted enzyme related to lactoylglutathione lyase
VNFYGGLFGWEFEDRMPAEAPGNYFVARLGGRDVAAIGSQQGSGTPTPAWSTYVLVDSADDTAKKVKDAGGSVIDEPFDVLDAGRVAVFADPSGAVFCVWQANRHRGAQLVNAPGTWNWSDLNTRDPEGAKAFYGAVFGWETTNVDFGDAGSFTMWRVPGYADFLERDDPDLRRRHERDGAPEGFSDAIAWLQPMTEDQLAANVPPHWSVAFSVDDTDAIVARAVELGGSVVVEPFDAPPVRIAVLSDPQGAVFSVNRYAPAS